MSCSLCRFLFHGYALGESIGGSWCRPLDFERASSSFRREAVRWPPFSVFCDKNIFWTTLGERDAFVCSEVLFVTRTSKCWMASHL